MFSSFSACLHPSSAGMFMSPSQMQFPVQAPAGYQAFPGMGTAMPPTTVMGAMMAQSGAAMMGPSPGMMVGMTMPNGFMGNAPATGVMGMAPRMMGPQGAAMPAGMVPAQGMYAIQPGQQPQWNMGQVWSQFHLWAFSLFNKHHTMAVIVRLCQVCGLPDRCPLFCMEPHPALTMHCTRMRGCAVKLWAEHSWTTRWQHKRDFKAGLVTNPHYVMLYSSTREINTKQQILITTRKTLFLYIKKQWTL